MPESKRRSGLTDSTEIISRLVDDADRRQRAARHKRDRSWDSRRAKATYDLPQELKEEIRTIAEVENVPAYEVARLFLEFGLSIYREGGLKALGVQKSQKAVEFTLFPK